MKIVKYFVFLNITIVSIIMSINSYYAKDRVAIVGNSQASMMSYYIDVDQTSVHTIDYGINSKGSIDLDTKDDEIVGFPKRAINYDDAIMFFGTNEILRGFTFEDFFNKLSKYINSVFQNNPNIKIFLVEIPRYSKKSKEYNNHSLIAATWNKMLELYAGNSENIYFVRLPKNYTLQDDLHLSSYDFTRLWYYITDNYYIDYIE